MRSARWAAARAVRRSPARPRRGIWPGCAVPSATTGVAGSAASARARRGDAHGAVRVEDESALAIDARHFLRAFGLVYALGAEIRADAPERAGGIANPPRLREIRHQPHATPPASRPVRLEQQTLEVGGDLNVHRRRLRRLDAPRLVAPGRERARENVVLVGGDDRAARSAAPCAWRNSRPGCRRNCRSARRSDRAVRRAERDGGDEIIDDLGEDARPVDRVDARKAHLVAESQIAEQVLDDALAVVERAFDRRAHGRSALPTVVIWRRWTSDTRPCG